MKKSFMFVLAALAFSLPALSSLADTIPIKDVLAQIDPATGRAKDNTKEFTVSGIVAARVVSAGVNFVLNADVGRTVDAAVIDVEGHEETILDSIDLARHGLRMLVFEHKHMTPEALDRIVTRLEAAGYRTKQYGRDCLAWRPPKG